MPGLKRFGLKEEVLVPRSGQVRAFGLTYPTVAFLKFRLLAICPASRTIGKLCIYLPEVLTPLCLLILSSHSGRSRRRVMAGEEGTAVLVALAAPTPPRWVTDT